MQNAALAYGTVAKQIANPRELEADLLLKAAARLQAIRDAWDRGRPDLDEALLYNRKLWSIFLTSVMGPEHPLPVAIRQNVANLGLFVMNHDVDDEQSAARAARVADQYQSRAGGRIAGQVAAPYADRANRPQI
jgi:flagellar protein FlaF